MDADIRKIVDENMKQYYEPIPRAVISGYVSWDDFHVGYDNEHPLNKVFSWIDWFIKHCGIIYIPILYVISLVIIFWIFA